MVAVALYFLRVGLNDGSRPAVPPSPRLLTFWGVHSSPTDTTLVLLLLLLLAAIIAARQREAEALSLEDARCASSVVRTSLPAACHEPLALPLLTPRLRAVLRRRACFAGRGGGAVEQDRTPTPINRDLSSSSSSSP